jgi:DnaK suppressor protein
MTQTLRQSALSSRQRDELRRALGDERRHTLESAGQLDRDVRTVQVSRHDTPTDDEHDPEGATLAFEQSQSSALLRQARERLTLVDDALVRLDGPDFGTCRSCTEPIGFARLSARPYTQHCIRCAQRLGAIR